MSDLKDTVLAMMLAAVLCLWFVGCDLNQKTDDPLKMKAPTKLWESVVPGVPFGQYRLGGWYKVHYIEADPYDELKSNVIIYCTYGAVLAGVGIILSFVMLYYKIPFWKDVLIISGIFFLGCFALALIVQYMAWILTGCAIAVTVYIAYVCWREQQHKKVKEEDDQTHEELVTTGALLKKFTNWGVDEHLAVVSAQSDKTISKVKAIEDKCEAKAKDILKAIPKLASLATA